MLLVLLNMVLMGLASLLTLMLAVTIGATAAKKHPILLAIAVYYGLSLVRMAAYLSTIDACGLSSNAAFASLAAANVVTILIAYFWMYYLTSRRLNLN